MKATSRFNRLDRVIAGLWWWQLHRRFAEGKINRAPEKADEIDQAYQEWKRYEFACRFGRTSEKEVAKAVSEAAKDGIDPNSLGLLKCTEI